MHVVEVVRMWSYFLLWFQNKWEWKDIQVFYLHD